MHRLRGRCCRTAELFAARQRNAALPLELQVAIGAAVLGVDVEQSQHGEMIRQVEATTLLELLPPAHEV